MTSGYEPLHLPLEEPKRKGWLPEFLGGGVGVEQGKSLVAQLEARSPIPPEVWGPDKDRQRLAAAMSTIITNTIPWPNAQFIPEDPFSLVTFALPNGKDDLELTEILMEMESLLGWDLDEGRLGLLDKTFGEVIETLIERTRTEQALPVIGPGAPENRLCPSLAIFLDLRNSVALYSPGLSRRMVYPSTKLHDVLSHRGVKAVDHYVRQRFDRDGFLGPEIRRVPLRVLCSGLVVVLLCVLLWLAWPVSGMSQNPDSGVWTWVQDLLYILWPVLFPVLFSGMFLVLLMVSLMFAGVVLPIPYQLAQRAICWKRSRNLTFGELVRHIQAARNRRLPQSAPPSCFSAFLCELCASALESIENYGRDARAPFRISFVDRCNRFTFRILNTRRDLALSCFFICTTLSKNAEFLS
ncbi:MAG: hypothetical protein IT365_16670 [Candidatus Hydrogenedentes bacterium]|nr:hypothetical protein [Candidatus Hydrogenedentota bacterium]